MTVVVPGVYPLLDTTPAAYSSPRTGMGVVTTVSNALVSHHSPASGHDLDEGRGEKVTGISSKLEEFDRYSRHLQLHEESDRWLVVVTDRSSGRVVYTIPPEELLDIVGRIRQFVGILLDIHV